MGVEYITGGERRVAYAEREVIVCAGSIASPHLLQVSGIGSPELLGALGIQVVAGREGVGANLQDHLEVYHSFEVLKPLSLQPHFETLAGSLQPHLWVRPYNGRPARTLGVGGCGGVWEPCGSRVLVCA